MNGVAGCPVLPVATTAPGEVLEEGGEFVTSCLAEDELVAECHRLVSIVPEVDESVDRKV